MLCTDKAIRDDAEGSFKIVSHTIGGAMKQRSNITLYRPTYTHVMLFIVALAFTAALSQYAFMYYSKLLFIMILAPLAYFSGGIVLFTTDTKKNPAFQILVVLLLWAFLSAVMNERRGESLLANQAELNALAVLAFVCFPAGYLAERSSVQTFLKWAPIATIAFVTLTDAAAIVMALIGKYVMLPFNSNFGLGIMPGYQRLAALCYPNSVGMIGMICVVLAVYLFLKAKRVIWRALCVLSILIIHIAVALANARTSEAALAFVFGLIAFSLVNVVLAKRSALLRWLAATLAVILFGAASFGLNVLIVRGFNAITSMRASVAALPTPAQSSDEPISSPSMNDAVSYEQPASNANEASAANEPVSSQPAPVATPPAQPAVGFAVDRPIQGDIGTLNGRTAIWQAALTEIGRDKSILLFGTSAGLAEQVIGQYPVSQGRNLHNSFLQMLFALGVPGLILMLAFLAITLVAAAHVFFAPLQSVGAERLLPVALIAVLLLSCMESFLLLYPYAYFANVWFVFLSGFLCRIASWDKAETTAVLDHR